MEQQGAAPPTTLRRIRDFITDGVKLDVVTPPACVFHDNTPTVDANADLVLRRIREYMDFGAIVELPSGHPLPFGIQPLHVIIKPGKKPRLVIDLSRNLNDGLQYEYFAYSSVRDAVDLSWQDCWYSKLDLSNCFLSFPLHQEALPHFVFRFQDQLDQFIRLPFGLSSAPRTCTELLSVVAFRLNLEGNTALVRYLDDFLHMHGTFVESQAGLTLAQRVLTAFGLVVNPDKTEGPAQQLAFLGVQLDSHAQTLACTPARVNELLSLLRAAATAKEMRLTELDSLVGKLQFAAQVLPGSARSHGA